MSATITVRVDDRGRFTVPKPAREAITIANRDTRIELSIRVLKPDDAEGNEAETTSDVDDRGRVTIKPPSTRDELDIRGRESILEIEIDKVGAES